MRQHNKSKTNATKTRSDAPTKHQIVIQGKKEKAKARAAASDEAKATYKIARAAFLATPPQPKTGYEEFIDRAPVKGAKVVSRANARLSKYTSGTG
jgi:hypothetical protein